MTRRPDPVIGAEGVEVTIGNVRLVSFGGCDTLGLSRHDEVVSSAHAGLDFLGAGATASRTTTGTMEPHVYLERTLARFFGTQDALHLPSGWLAGQCFARALAPECDVVVIDEHAHPALADAATLTGLPVRRYRHFDAADARRVAGRDRVLVLTDGVDIAVGAVAPLRALASVATKLRGHLLVDDALGAGVLGNYGRGSIEATRAAGPRVHLAGSLSKAFGGQGGFVVGSRRRMDTVRERAPAIAGATPLAPGAAAAAECAVELAMDGALRARVFANAARMRRHFTALGLPVPRHKTPWFAVGAGHAAEDLAALSQNLAAAGFLVPHVRYFGGPEGGFLKVAVSAAHTAEQIDALADSVEATGAAA